MKKTLKKNLTKVMRASYPVHSTAPTWRLQEIKWEREWEWDATVGAIITLSCHCET